MKKMLKCKSNHEYFQKEKEISIKKGQYEIGLCIAKKNLLNNELEKFVALEDEVLLDIIKKDNGIESIHVTYHNDEVGLYKSTLYFVMYEDVDASCFKKTKLKLDYDEELTLEILFSLNDNDFCYRFYEYKYRTCENSPVRFNFLDLENIFEEIIENGEQGIERNEEGGYSVEVFDKIGNPIYLDMCSIDEIIGNVVSVRYV